MMTLLFVAHFVNAPNVFKVRLFSENLKVEDWESISWTKDDKPYYLEGHDLMCTLKFIMASIFHKLTWFSINLDVDTQARENTFLWKTSSGLWRFCKGENVFKSSLQYEYFAKQRKKHPKSWLKPLLLDGFFGRGRCQSFTHGGFLFWGKTVFWHQMQQGGI